MQGYASGKYTQMKENEMWGYVGQEYDKDEDYDELLAIINSPDYFRPFSKRLLAFYNDILGGNLNCTEAAKDLRGRLNQKGLFLSRGTINNWFNGGTEPQYGDEDRRRLFVVAFALELSIEQTERLFHNVFLDKAFNRRNRNEFIYLYCIYNKKPLTIAEGLISRLDAADSAAAPIGHTVQSQLLGEAAKRDVSEDEILEYILANPYNFSLNNTAAKKRVQKLLKELTGYGGNKGLAQQEQERYQIDVEGEGGEKENVYKNKDRASVDYMLSVLFNMDFAQKDNPGIVPIRETFRRKEITAHFPEKQTLSKENPSSYELRKNIILLFFYKFWASALLDKQAESKTGQGLCKNKMSKYDKFVSEMDEILFECGFSPLYSGNPYDWLFKYCSACHNPLDAFRGILASKLPELWN